MTIPGLKPIKAISQALSKASGITVRELLRLIKKGAGQTWLYGYT
jgi:hypothetical protein